MKKARILVVVLMTGMLLAGAGYATWTDSIAVSSTVRVGELASTFTEASITGDSYVVVTQPYLAKASRTNSILCEASNLYPGGGAVLNAAFKNDGTIPAKITSIAVGSDGDGAVPSGYGRLTDLSEFIVEKGTFEIDKAGTEKDLSINLAGKKLSEIQDYLNRNVADKGVVLEPSKGTEAETIKLKDFHFILNSEAQELEKSWTKFTININLGQN